jgi:hypothetical protein
MCFFEEGYHMVTMTLERYGIMPKMLKVDSKI